MGTRAVFSFQDERSTHHVYKHWDGTPDNGVALIRKAIGYAWPLTGQLPRFEADEFAAAFVAVAKTGSGDVRLANSNDQLDLAYTFLVTLKNNRLHVVIEYKENNSLVYKGFVDDYATKEPQTQVSSE